MRERGTLGDWNREVRRSLLLPPLQWDAIVLNLNAMLNPRCINCQGAGRKWGVGREAWCIKVLPLGQVGLHPPHELKFSGNDA